MPSDAQRPLRFVAVGLFATAVHYLLLFWLVEVVAVRPIWLANLPAALLGIVSSFIGNYRVVFCATI